MNYDESIDKQMVRCLKDKVPDWVIGCMTMIATQQGRLFVTLEADNLVHMIDSSLNAIISEIEQAGLMLLDLKTNVSIRYGAFHSVHYHEPGHEYFTPLEMLRADFNTWCSKIAYAILCSGVSDVFVVLDDNRKWIKVSHGPIVMTVTQQTQKTINDLLKACDLMKFNVILDQIRIFAKDIDEARKSLRLSVIRQT